MAFLRFGFACASLNQQVDSAALPSFAPVTRCPLQTASIALRPEHHPQPRLIAMSASTVRFCCFHAVLPLHTAFNINHGA
jgi:hypothetical protein